MPVTIEFIPKLQLELILEDDEIEKAIKAIARGAYTGSPGDRRIIEIIVLPVEVNIRIREYHENSKD